jgi:plasmid maintenance system killer protein
MRQIESVMRSYFLRDEAVARRESLAKDRCWKLHALGGDLSGHWSVWLSGNWRLAFTFDGEDAILVDYLDYH